MGLGRITRFAKTPPGAARFSVMRLGPGGLKILSPSKQLLSEFKEKKAGLMKGGMGPGEAHAEAFRLVNYRERFRREVLSNPDVVKAMGVLIEGTSYGVTHYKYYKSIFRSIPSAIGVMIIRPFQV